MRRLTVSPRTDWQKKVEDLGLIFHTTEDGAPYWNEQACYEFSAKEIDLIESATNELSRMCLKAAEHVIEQNLFARFGIPEFAVEAIKSAWEEEPPSIYGRFDFAYDGSRAPKLLEFNADTPTSLLEASVIQWYWLKDVFPQYDQFNSIDERLLTKWNELRDYLQGNVIHFACIDTEEDMMTVTYLRDTAERTGFSTIPLLMEDIGWDAISGSFVDLQNLPIHTIFKLYPWEWMVHEEFGKHLLSSYTTKSKWIEPIWKMVLSNKGVLPILWELYPDHPNLLESYFDGPGNMKEFVVKPLLSREGANITINAKGLELKTDGDYGEEGYIYQAFAKLNDFDGNYPVIGSWLINWESAGVGIRESDNLVTDNLSRFVPHFFN